MPSHLTVTELSALLMLVLNLAALMKMWASWERRMIVIETYMRLILPKLGVNITDAPTRRGDNLAGGE